MKDAVAVTRVAGSERVGGLGSLSAFGLVCKHAIGVQIGVLHGVQYNTVNIIGRNFASALLFGLACLILVGCPLNQPLNVGDLSSVSGDVDAVVLRYNPDTLDMKPVAATLRNVTILQTLRG